VEQYLDSLEVKPTILCFSEHWLEEDEYNSTKIEGYKLASSYVRTHKSHGGTCVYIDEDLEYVALSDLVNLSEELSCECSAIKLEDLRLIVLCIYRSNAGEIGCFFRVVHEMLQRLDSHIIKYTLIVCGDFNINMLAKNRNVTEFKNFLNMYNLHQTIHEPTRVSSHSSTLIDNIFVNSTDNLMGKVLKTSLSDHYGQMLEIPMVNSNINKIKYIYKRIYSTGKLNAMRNECLLMEWEDIYTENNINKAYNKFNFKLTGMHNQIFPRKKLTKRKNNINWLTKGIRISCETKRKMYAQKIHGEIDGDTYDIYVKTLRAVMAEAKRMSYNRFVSDSINKSKATWNLVKELTVNDDGTRIPIKHLCEKYKDPHTAADSINKYFTNMCPLLNQTGQTDTSKLMENQRSLYVDPVTMSEVYNLIMNLKNTSAVGIDDIPVKVLKYLADIICVPLTYLINLSFTTGEFPDYLKTSITKPQYKKGSKSEVGNYRPISILSNISKIFEKAIFKRMQNFLEMTNIITNNQNGFRTNKSTTHTIYQGISEILTSLNNKKATTCVMVDLSKAFDSVQHQILFNKLYKCGIRGLAFKLIENYLQNRTQITEINMTVNEVYRSPPSNIHMGVPQGSILGPLLFIVYMNDIVGVLPESIYLYADDTNIIFSSPDKDKIQSNISDALNKLNKWFTNNNLKMNIEKTQIVNFLYRLPQTPELTICYDTEVIKSATSASFLGVTIDSRLDWKQHIDEICKNMARFCYALRLISKMVNEKTALMCYHAYIESRMRYGVIFWCNSSDSNRIFIMQKRSIRSIFKMNQRESCREIFNQYGILTLYSMYILEAIMFVAKNPKFFQPYGSSHSYDTRNRTDLKPYTPNANYIRDNVQYMVMTVYNCLPPDIRNLPGNQLRKILTQYLKKKTYYSVEDFINDNHQEICELL